MIQNMTYNMTHLSNISNPFRRFSRRVLLLLALLLATAGVKARDYVLTWTSGGTTYYVGMKGNNIAVKTEFDPTCCIWTCYNGNTETELGGTSYSLRNKNNNTYYLTTSCDRGFAGTSYTWSALNVQTGASNIWRSSSGTNGKVYAYASGTYLLGSWNRSASIRVVNNAWAMLDNDTNGSQNYQVTTTTVNPVDNTTLPTISISGTSGNTITFGHTAMTGTYTPGYTKYEFNSTHYWYENTDHGSAPAETQVNPTYRWSIASGGSYASITSDTGVLTLGDEENVTGNITVRLNVENLGLQGNKTVDFVLTRTHTGEEKSVVGSISDPTVSPTSHTFNYGERQTFTASATATVTTTTTPSYTTLTGGGNTYYYYDGTLNASAPTASAPVETHPTPTFTWVLTGAAATGGYLTPTSGSGASMTINYGKISTSEVTGTLTVTASIDLPGVASKTATASLTATKTSVSDILVYPEEIIVGVGANRQFNYTLQPLGITSTVTVTSGNTSIATFVKSDNTITVHGVAHGRTTMTLAVDGTSLTREVTVIVVDDCAPPTITFTPMSGGSTATVTLSSTPSDATIYYTTDGSYPTTSSTAYSGPFTVNSGQTVNAIAVKEGYRDSEEAIATYSPDKVATPTINNTSSGVTFSCATTGVTYYYTTDNSEPTLSSTQWNGSAITGITDGATIKVIAAHADMLNSDVASYVYHPASGANGTIVTINDAEDHRWSYYSDSECPIRSLNPADVKITYLGNGIMMTGTTDYTSGATTGWVRQDNSNYVGSAFINVPDNEHQDTFVYYKTLERTDGSTSANPTGRCAYTTIPNPFQVRPTYGTPPTSNRASWTGWRGFQCWRLKSVSNGSVYSGASGGTALSTGDVINAETEIYFAPSSEYGMTVDLEAVWSIAYIVYATGNGNFSVPNHAELGYERNFVVLSTNKDFYFGGGGGNNAANITNINRPSTISPYLPNGTSGNNQIGRVKGVYANNANNRHLTLGANTKFDILVPSLWLVK